MFIIVVDDVISEKCRTLNRDVPLLE